MTNMGDDAIAMVPPNSTIAPTNSPEVTGGGNAGYNEHLLKDQW